MPVVAVVGRPNVGKSTLVNRVLGRREAIVEERPGVTRDRKEVEAEWRGEPFVLVDTGGWLPGGDRLDEKVSHQAELAMGRADAVILVVDATVGVTEEDARVADLLRRGDRPVFLVANKVDTPARDALIWEFVGLGLGDPWPVSALHGRGTADVLDAVLDRVHGPQRSPGAVPQGEEELGKPFAVAIVGRPNAGKSTLFNRLTGEDRSVVHDIAGTTRDSIDTIVETDQGPIRFVDTAGMRRRAKVDEETEYYSVLRALRSVDDADVAVLVVDSTVGVTHQDQRLAERVDASGCPAVVVLNKWDLVDEVQREVVERQVGERLHFLGEAPVLRISARTGRGVQRILPALGSAFEAYERRIPTARVNQVIRAAQTAQPAPGGARVLYATQGAAHPPTFTLFASRALPQPYLRYLERSLREAFDLGSTPVKLRVRRRSG